MKITNIELKKILNSKNEETIQSVVTTAKSIGIAASPAGKSTGKHEKIHLKKNVDETIKISEPILKKITGYDTSQQKEIDAVLREIPGAASISTSVAVAYAAAAENNLPLWKYLGGETKPRVPTLINLVFAGGKHAPNGPNFQEFHVMHENIPIKEQIAKNLETYSNIGKKLKLRETDSEHGWVTCFSDEDCIKELKNYNCAIGVDAAASELFNSKYIYKDKEMSREEQIQYAIDLIEKYQIRYFEDPLQEDDFDGFAEILGSAKKCLVAGDDLTTTNKERLQKAINLKSINAVIIKPNQVGTLTETIDTIKLAQKNNIECVTSHRAGETKDTYLSHITLAFNIPYMKISIIGEERTCKLNELQKQLEN